MNSSSIWEVMREVNNMLRVEPPQNWVWVHELKCPINQTSFIPRNFRKFVNTMIGCVKTCFQTLPWRVSFWKPPQNNKNKTRVRCLCMLSTSKQQNERTRERIKEKQPSVGTPPCPPQGNATIASIVAIISSWSSVNTNIGPATTWPLHQPSPPSLFPLSFLKTSITHKYPSWTRTRSVDGSY